jgi:hypothetical protein
MALASGLGGFEWFNRPTAVNPLVPKLQLGNPEREALASRNRKLELSQQNSQAELEIQRKLKRYTSGETINGTICSNQKVFRKN